MRFINFTVFHSVSDLARNVITQKSFIPNYKGKESSVNAGYHIGITDQFM